MATPQELNDLLIQLATQSSGVQAPQANRGLLAPGQESFGDVLRDPSQSQVSGLITGIAASLNPNTVSPLASGIFGGLQGFQEREDINLKSRQQAAQFKRQELQDRIGNIIDISRLGISQSAESRAQDTFKQVTLPGAERAQNIFEQVTLPGAARAEAGELRAVRGEERTVAGRQQVNLAIPTGGGAFKTEAFLTDGRGGFFDIQNNPVTLPAGTRKATVGKTEADIAAGGFSQLTRTQVGKSQEKLIRFEKKLNVLQEVATRDLNKLLSTKGRVTSKIGTILDFATGLGGETTADIIEQFSGVNPIQFAAESRTLFEDLENFFNIHRKDITGAQAAFLELEQLRKSVLSGDLPPAQAMASLAQTLRRVGEAIEIEKRALREGLDISPGDKTERINRIRNIINQGQ